MMGTVFEDPSLAKVIALRDCVNLFAIVFNITTRTKQPYEGRVLN